MPHALAELAGDALSPGYRALLRRYRYGPATVKVDWALDGPIPWEAPEARGAGTVHVAGDDAELLRRSRPAGTAFRIGPTCWSASNRSPIPPAHPPASTRRGPTRAGHGPGSTGAPRSRRSSSAWRPRSSGSRPGSAT